METDRPFRSKAAPHCEWVLVPALANRRCVIHPILLWPPSTFAPAHSSTPSRTFGCRSPRSLPVPPSVTSCKIEPKSGS